MTKQAVDLIARVLREGMTPNTLHWEPAFAGLHGYAPFEALYKPVIDPARVEARIYRSDGTLSLVGPDGTLEGEDVVPGFSCPLADITRVG